jgi:hypothetical protein
MEDAMPYNNTYKRTKRKDEKNPFIGEYHLDVYSDGANHEHRAEPVPVRRWK